MRAVVRADGVPPLRAIWWAALVGVLCIPVASAQEVVSDPPGRVARLSHTEGAVVLAPAGTEEWAEAILNRPLTSGDRLWVESGARAEVQIGSAAVYLDERTSFGFVELDDAIMQMSLTGGAATLRVRRRADNETIQIETPNAAVSLTKPGEYHIEVDAEADRTIVRTRHGEAEVFGSNQTHLVRADEQATLSGLDDLSVHVMQLGPRTSFENWANDRERREHESKSAQYVSRDVVGYEDLDAHGDWLHEPEYGYVWRPRYVAHTWAPYRDGRWVWVSPWGWSWVDHTPWGFAPFHYGRWAHVRNRWCWVPGPRHLRPVYAPALVGWVGGPHVGVSLSFGSGVGWFPLGPREIYYPGYRHSPRYIRHVNVSNTIIVNNTYITNVYAGRHRGIDYRYGRHPHAVTVVERNHFISGRPVRGRVLRDADLREWRTQHRPPALTPNRESVLAGAVRRGPPASYTARDRNNHRIAPDRVAFETERRQIEANGGRPIGRTHLYRDGANRSGELNRNTLRPGTGERTPRMSSERSNATANGPSHNPRAQTTPGRDSPADRLRSGRENAAVAPSDRSSSVHALRAREQQPPAGVVRQAEGAGRVRQESSPASRVMSREPSTDDARARESRPDRAGSIAPRVSAREREPGRVQAPAEVRTHSWRAPPQQGSQPYSSSPARGTAISPSYESSRPAPVERQAAPPRQSEPSPAPRAEASTSNSPRIHSAPRHDPPATRSNAPRARESSGTRSYHKR